MQKPYDIDRRLVIYRARAIYRKNRGQLVAWAAIYMLLSYWQILSALFFPSQAAMEAVYLIRLALMPLLLGMYAWLHNIIHSKERAHTGFLEPLRWIKTRSPGRFALLVLVVVGAAHLQYSLTTTVYMYLLSQIILPAEPFFRSAFTGNYLVTAVALLTPFLYGPVYLFLQWIVDYYCIHAVQTGGRKAFGIIDSFFPILGDILRIEARLITRILWIPAVLYCAFTALAVNVKGLDSLVLGFSHLMNITFLGFGFVYYPVSALSRSLLILEHPRKTPLPEEPVDFQEIDVGYIPRTAMEKASVDSPSAGEQP